YVTVTGNGKATVTAELDGRREVVEVIVSEAGPPGPVSFRNEIIPVLNRAGCNAGACHGTPNGKGGFKLSLRGYDPEFDYHVLTREAFGRRTNPVDPDHSLILEKALALVPHQRGQRFAAGSAEHR